MSKSMLFFIAVLIVALGARPVLAGDGREYVGATSGSTAPNIGFTAMHDLCHADFPRARICLSSHRISFATGVLARLYPLPARGSTPHWSTSPDRDIPSTLTAMAYWPSASCRA